MNAEPNLEEYPKLTPPDVVYEHKASLKKTVVIPLYAKIIAAAAAVALLFGIFWLRSGLPEQELVAELNAVKVDVLETEESYPLAESQARFVVPKKTVDPSVKPKMQEVSYERTEMPLLAELQPKTALILMPMDYQLLQDVDVFYASNDLVTTMEEYDYDENDYEEEMSLVGRSIYKWTDGEHDSFASMVSEGLQSFKTEMASIATTIQSSRSQLRQMVR
ncbi:MAG: hypothetical protein IKM99_06315 [Bacteroidales bacterium]|nr:hypothetical protein [Bacteroidales bacterium]